MLTDISLKQSPKKRALNFILLTAAGLLINFGGARLAQGFRLPLFLDTAGTITAAALGGSIPGVTVGFLTNMINSVQDHSTLYYGSMNVLIAIVTAWFSRKGYFRKIRGLLLSILVFSLIGGGLGSMVTWLIYGLDFGNGISAPLAHRIYDAGVLNAFWSQFSADMIIDLADKTVSVLFAAGIVFLLPEKVKVDLFFHGWRQTPLTKKQETRARRQLSRRWSLRSKLLLMIALAVTLAAAAVAWVSVGLYHDSMIEQQTSLAYGVANVVSSNIDPSRVDEFLEKGEEAPGYTEVRKRLSDIMRSTPDIEFVYVYRILEDGCHVVFDPDTDEVKGESAGTVIPFEDAFMKYVPALLSGGAIEPVVSNETYGWLLTVYQPILDKNGVCQCYAGVDISMRELAKSERVFVTKEFSLFVGFFILILVLSLWLAEYNVILPINSMSLAAGSFAYNTEDARTESVERIRELEIRTGDEIENLYQSLTKTTADMMGYVEDVRNKGEVIEKMQNGLIMVLADMVESRDKCTGDHVRNTAAYARIILERLRKDGVYTEMLTDKYVEDVVNSAPLHDVGKIQIPDDVLNKPGKLTEEEFERMKKHTSAGGEIIQQAIGAISEDTSGYLKEAGNLARYHHEKWDGTGYPEGLSGEDIPLSARVMAVADVFDALVSKRSYKEGFPFEKAMNIIREGTGTHFDPNVVKAFLESEEQVRAVMESHSGNS